MSCYWCLVCLLVVFGGSDSLIVLWCTYFCGCYVFQCLLFGFAVGLRFLVTSICWLFDCGCCCDCFAWCGCRGFLLAF